MDAGNGGNRGQQKSTLVDAIVHYKRRIECESHDDEKVLHALKKLRSYPIDVASLQATDVWRTVSDLKTRSGEVGNISRALVHDWKNVVNGSKSSASSYKTVVKKNRRHRLHDDADVAAVDKSSTKKIRIRVERDASVASRSSSKSSRSNRTGKSDAHDVASKNGHVAEINVEPTTITTTATTTVLPPSSSANTLSGRRCDPETMDGVARDNSTVFTSLEGVHAKDTARKSKKTKSTKLLMDSGGEGFNASMASFEDCLGINDFKSKRSSTTVGVSIRKKTKKKSEVNSSSSTSSSASSPPPPPLMLPPPPPPPPPPKPKKSSLSSNALPSLLAVDPRELQMSPSDSSSSPSSSTSTTSPSRKTYASHVDILSSLPAIQTDYKPFRFPTPDSPPSRFKRELTESTTFMSPRHTRTQVFSGRRSQFLTQVPTLLKSCIKVLQENVAVLNDLMFAPYEHLKPALVRCTPDQLLYLEEMNPYILDETDELWRLHCQREFKGYEPDEFESWRELYYRVSVARTSRLKSITANISASMAKAVPVRQTKLAFLDCEAKPPRQVARQQARFGTASHVKGEQSAAVIKLGRTKTSSAIGSGATSSGSSKIHSESLASSVSSSSAVSNGPSTSQSPTKAVKKVAPLMQKTLKFMKNRFRR